MKCREGCGACCIAPSISSPLPGMPLGKPAGVRCVHLSAEQLCQLFGQPQRPEGSYPSIGPNHVDPPMQTHRVFYRSFTGGIVRDIGAIKSGVQLVGSCSKLLRVAVNEYRYCASGF